MGLDSIRSCRAIIVPGYICDGTICLNLSTEIGAIAAWLRHQHALGATVCASCNGVGSILYKFLLDLTDGASWPGHDQAAGLSTGA